MKKLKFGIPKGSLEKATTDLFAKAGWVIKTSSRNYFPTVDDPHLSCAIIRAQEIAHYVEEGVLDAAITGKDWILESGSDVVEVQEMIYSKESPRPARWVLVVTEDSPIQRIEDLQGKKIATELVSFTKKYFSERAINVKVEFSWGTTEAKVVEGLVDAIVDVTETGSTIRAHHLRIVQTGKKDPLASTHEAIHFPINLLFPLKEAEESQLVIIQRDHGLVFSIDWFPGEEFEAQAFFSPDRRELLLLSHFEREVILLHLS